MDLAARVGSAAPLRIAGLTAYASPGFALTDIDLAVGEGELLALAGEPGSGKSTLVRCVVGELGPVRGEIQVCGEGLAGSPVDVEGQGVSVVWQDLALCDNLDVAANLLLGQESRRMMLSQARFHAAARSILDEFGLLSVSTTQLAGSLSAVQRQMLAIARAMSRNPRLLVLDEPTESLGSIETELVEALIARLREGGTAVLLASRDVKQMFRVADRIVVLRHGRRVGEIVPGESHPDELAALISGQPVDSTARRQLTRLHGLAGRLVSADPSSSLSLILSALGGALGVERACIHVVRGDGLHGAAWLGLSPREMEVRSDLPLGGGGGAVGRAGMSGERVVEAGQWSVPVSDGEGVCAVITVFQDGDREPQQDELDLLTLYAGYAAAAIERDRLLHQVTARNRVLETIRDMLETLTGTVPVGDGLPVALGSLRHGLRAVEVGLLCEDRLGNAVWRAFAGPLGADPSGATIALRFAADQVLRGGPRDGSAVELSVEPAGRVLAAGFEAPEGPAVLLAAWPDLADPQQEKALIENAAHSLRLALEREEAAVAHQEAAALRRSQEMQRDFLSRLSHELRTPLTAIRGYATSLLQTDVTWDRDSEQRFLRRIAAEAARMGRLVGDLLDFSAIESGVMRLIPDWCDIGLVSEAAVALLPADGAEAVTVSCETGLPPIWADHDRLEQVFVNLLGNALSHNPKGTQINVSARLAGAEVEVLVCDDGAGLPERRRASPFEAARRPRTRNGGAGLGLSIAKGIIEAHGGTIELMPVSSGTSFRIRLPVEAGPERSPIDVPELAEVLAGDPDTGRASMISGLRDAGAPLA
jgi:signal transduction histidine kinase/ABC-type branched-subunit amino acid transport system ATPase component